MPDLSARFAIHRKSQPRSMPQFAGATGDGLAWLADWNASFTFETAQAAWDFVRARMGDHGEDAEVVRHTIH